MLFASQNSDDKKLRLPFSEDFMKSRVQSLCFLTALVLFLSVGISLNAQQTTPQPIPPDPQAQQPTSDQPAPPAAPEQSTQQTPSQPPSQAPDQTTQPAPNSPAESAQPTGVQSFSGTIVKSGDKYMLKEEASGQTYDIDHQDEVQKYEGKRVKVHGTLDGKMIHLQ
jgi:outer membrane biosynthesis protein TonB